MSTFTWFKPTPARQWAGIVTLLLVGSSSAMAQSSPAAGAAVAATPPGFEAATTGAIARADSAAAQAAAGYGAAAPCQDRHTHGRRYHVQQLDVPGGAFEGFPTAINNRGWVVGYTAGTPGVTATLWIGSRVFALDGLGSVSYAYDVNDAGKIVGFSFDPAGTMRAMSWYRGRARVLPSLGNTAGQSVARGINNKGVIAGESALPNVTSVRAVTWVHEVPRALEHLGGSLAFANRINDPGYSVGAANLTDATLHGALWNPAGDIVDLGAQSVPLDINNSGRIVGYSFQDEQARPLKWQRGVRTVLPTLGGQNGVAFGINEKDEAVGYSQTATGLERATIWFGLKPVQLDTLLAPEDTGMVIHAAYAVNDKGQIAAIRRLPNNRVQPLLLTPHHCHGN